MPFTFAHAAAAIPLRRSRLILSALIVGTMAPDFEYFIRLRPGGGWGHTIPGAFGLSLPLGLVVLWLFHAFAKQPAVALLPNGFQRRLGPYLQPFPFLGFRRFLLILLSMLIGIATHIVWDSFTHSRNWLYHHVRLLHQWVRLPFIHPMPLHAFLQIFSSVVGVLIVGLWILQWYRTTPPDSRPWQAVFPPGQKIIILAGIFALTIAGGALRGYLYTGIPTRLHLLEDFLSLGVVTSIALLWWQLVVWGVLMRAGFVPSATQSKLIPR